MWFGITVEKLVVATFKMVIICGCALSMVIKVDDCARRGGAHYSVNSKQ